MDIGEMVRQGTGGMMKVVDAFDDMCECVIIDSEGVVRRRIVPVGQLSPVRDSLRQRSLWPSVRDVDLLQIEEEERRAKFARKQRDKAARKARRSLKTKRKGTS